MGSACQFEVNYNNTSRTNGDGAMTEWCCFLEEIFSLHRLIALIVCCVWCSAARHVSLEIEPPGKRFYIYMFCYSRVQVKQEITELHCLNLIKEMYWNLYHAYDGQASFFSNSAELLDCLQMGERWLKASNLQQVMDNILWSSYFVHLYHHCWLPYITDSENLIFYPSF